MMDLSVCPQVTFLSSFVITLITRITKTFMNRFNMCPEVYFPISYIVTLTTRIKNTFMN